MRFRKGDKVKCWREGARSRGTWARFEGRTGTVRVGRNDGGEVGVWLGQYTPEGNERILWFKPTELVKL